MVNLKNKAFIKFLSNNKFLKNKFIRKFNIILDRHLVNFTGEYTLASDIFI